ncbi:MAG: hypothetical protein V3U80_08355 [Flavobacteriaceae bacterium]
MKKINLFQKTYIDILCPLYTENLWHIISLINNNQISHNELKTTVLSILNYLLENKILFVIDEIIDNKTFIRSKLNKDQTIQFIDSKWNEKIDFMDLYLLAWFRFEDWYIDGLTKKGLVSIKDWQKFVAKEIGDLEKWINNNKPKE